MAMTQFTTKRNDDDASKSGNSEDEVVDCNNHGNTESATMALKKTTTTTNIKAPMYVDWIGRTVHRRDAAWEDDILMEGIVTNAYQYQRDWYFRIRYENRR